MERVCSCTICGPDYPANPDEYCQEKLSQAPSLGPVPTGTPFPAVSTEGSLDDSATVQDTTEFDPWEVETVRNTATEVSADLVVGTTDIWDWWPYGALALGSVLTLAGVLIYIIRYRCFLLFFFTNSFK